MSTDDPGLKIRDRLVVITCITAGKTRIPVESVYMSTGYKACYILHPEEHDLVSSQMKRVICSEAAQLLE